LRESAEKKKREAVAAAKKAAVDYKYRVGETVAFGRMNSVGECLERYVVQAVYSNGTVRLTSGLRIHDNVKRLYVRPLTDSERADDL